MNTDIQTLRKRAKELRTNQTDAEKKLWYYLRARRFNGLKFYRQFVISPYIVDFVCRDQKLIIELDGSQHLDNKASDQLRTSRLELQGYKVLRFWNDQVLRQTSAVLESINNEC